ncbi:hypothetical protein KIN20_005735 [Parelaphostrongylus tenuis]|uniref:G-protein coupled receptors family 1 profile domain-containing protein n=1 Tax=Parelaphostrongylus tenuis TaxID=148309 RepID=A0AAD5MJC5_PARTN|nr:hypothetical protein KIN20_005735 [Parelaphostrongylus tenuis]
MTIHSTSRVKARLRDRTEQHQDFHICCRQEGRKKLTMVIEEIRSVRLICAFVVLIPTLSGMALHFIVIAAFYKGWTNFRSNSFYLIIMQTVGCSIYLLFIYLYIVFPITLTGVQYMGESFVFYKLPLYFHSVAYVAMLLLTFLLTINRLTIFVFPRINSVLFATKNTLIMSGVIWVYTVSSMTFNQLSGCTKKFSSEGFHIWIDCTEQHKNGHNYDNIQHYQFNLMAVSMCFIYLTIYLKLKTTRQNIDQGAIKKEIVFLIQTIPTSLLSVVALAMFKIIPAIGETGYPRLVATFVNLIIIADNIVSPIMMLIFNRDVRRHLAEFTFYGNENKLIAKKSLFEKSAKELGMVITDRNAVVTLPVGEMGQLDGLVFVLLCSCDSTFQSLTTPSNS